MMGLARNRAASHDAFIHSPSFWRTAAAIGFALATLISAALPSHAQLSDRDRADIARIEDFFNSITTMTARFIQLSPNGRFAQGTIHMQRPDKLRFEYDPPVSYLLIVDDGDPVFYDQTEAMGDPVFWSVNDTPLKFLFGEVKLEGNVAILGVERGPGILRIRLAELEKEDEWKVEITFSDRPFALKKWSIVDPEGAAIHVAIMEPRFGVEIDPQLFVFRTDKRMEGRAGRDR